MNKRVLALITAAAVLMSLACVAVAQEQNQPPAETQKIIVTGRSTVEGKDFGGAIMRAKTDALRTAIEQVLGLELQSEAVLRNELLDQSTLRTCSRGGIKTYRMLEYKLQDNMMLVRLEVEVVPSPELTPIRLFTELSGVPRIAVVAKPDAPMVTQLAMDALKQQLLQAGCELLDRSGILEIEAELSHNLAEQKTLHAAVNQRADMVIYAHTVNSRSQFDGASENASVVFEALAFDTMQGNLISVQKAQGRAVHSERFEAEQIAALQAGNAVASKMEPALRAWWAKQLTAGVPYQMRIGNISNEKTIEFVNEIRSQPGIVDAVLIKWENDAARIIVRFFGSNDQLQRVINNACRQTTGMRDYRVRKADDRYFIVG